MAKFSKRFLVSKRFLGLVFIVAASNIAAGTERKSPIEFDVDWKLSLNAHGEIVGLKPAGEKVLPAVRKQLASIVRGWDFTPGKINGQPAATETTLRVRVSLEEASLNYKMHIFSAATGTMYRHMVVPKYPEDALRSGYEGKVWLRVDYDGRGEVVAVAPMAGRLPVDPSLTQAAVDAVKTWSFEPEKVGGYDRRGAAIVPICFKLRPDEEICRSNPLQKPEGMSAFANGNGPISVDSVVSVDMGSGNQMP